MMPQRACRRTSACFLALGLALCLVNACCRSTPEQAVGPFLPSAAPPANANSESNTGLTPQSPRQPLIATESERSPVLGSDGKPIGEAGRVRYTSGQDPCPPPDAQCDIRETERCEVHERVTCKPECHAYRTQRFTCENGGWGLRETREAMCHCEPAAPPVELAGCVTRYVSVVPSESSASEGCTLALTCGGRDLWVECDAENDGTNTSLCDCWRDRERIESIGGLYPGEGPEACFRGAADCSKVR